MGIVSSLPSRLGFPSEIVPNLTPHGKRDFEANLDFFTDVFPPPIPPFPPFPPIPPISSATTCLNLDKPVVVCPIDKLPELFPSEKLNKPTLAATNKHQPPTRVPPYVYIPVQTDDLYLAPPFEQNVTVPHKVTTTKVPPKSFWDSSLSQCENKKDRNKKSRHRHRYCDEDSEETDSIILSTRPVDQRRCQLKFWKKICKPLGRNANTLRTGQYPFDADTQPQICQCWRAPSLRRVCENKAQPLGQSLQPIFLRENCPCINKQPRCVCSRSTFVSCKRRRMKCMNMPCIATHQKKPCCCQCRCTPCCTQASKTASEKHCSTTKNGCNNYRYDSCCSPASETGKTMPRPTAQNVVGSDVYAENDITQVNATVFRSVQISLRNANKKSQKVKKYNFSLDTIKVLCSLLSRTKGKLSETSTNHHDDRVTNVTYNPMEDMLNPNNIASRTSRRMLTPTLCRGGSSSLFNESNSVTFLRDISLGRHIKELLKSFDQDLSHLPYQSTCKSEKTEGRENHFGSDKTMKLCCSCWTQLPLDNCHTGTEFVPNTPRVCQQVLCSCKAEKTCEKCTVIHKMPKISEDCCNEHTPAEGACVCCNNIIQKHRADTKNTGVNTMESGTRQWQSSCCCDCACDSYKMESYDVCHMISPFPVKSENDVFFSSPGRSDLRKARASSSHDLKSVDTALSPCQLTPADSTTAEVEDIEDYSANVSQNSSTIAVSDKSDTADPCPSIDKRKVCAECKCCKSKAKQSYCRNHELVPEKKTSTRNCREPCTGKISCNETYYLCDHRAQQRDEQCSTKRTLERQKSCSRMDTLYSKCSRRYNNCCRNRGAVSPACERRGRTNIRDNSQKIAFRENDIQRQNTSRICREESGCNQESLSSQANDFSSEKCCTFRKDEPCVCPNKEERQQGERNSFCYPRIDYDRRVKETQCLKESKCLLADKQGCERHDECLDNPCWHRPKKVEVCRKKPTAKENIELCEVIETEASRKPCMDFNNEDIYHNTEDNKHGFSAKVKSCEAKEPRRKWSKPVVGSGSFVYKFKESDSTFSVKSHGGCRDKKYKKHRRTYDKDTQHSRHNACSHYNDKPCKDNSEGHNCSSGGCSKYEQRVTSSYNSACFAPCSSSTRNECRNSQFSSTEQHRNSYMPNPTFSLRHCSTAKQSHPTDSIYYEQPQIERPQTVYSQFSPAEQHHSCHMPNPTFSLGHCCSTEKKSHPTDCINFEQPRSEQYQTACCTRSKHSLRRCCDHIKDQIHQGGCCQQGSCDLSVSLSVQDDCPNAGERHSQVNVSLQRKAGEKSSLNLSLGSSDHKRCNREQSCKPCSCCVLKRANEPQTKDYFSSCYKCPENYSTVQPAKCTQNEAQTKHDIFPCYRCPENDSTAQPARCTQNEPRTNRSNCEIITTDCGQTEAEGNCGKICDRGKPGACKPHTLKQSYKGYNCSERCSSCSVCLCGRCTGVKKDAKEFHYSCGSYRTESPNTGSCVMKSQSRTQCQQDKHEYSCYDQLTTDSQTKGSSIFCDNNKENSCKSIKNPQPKRKNKIFKHFMPYRKPCQCPKDDCKSNHSSENQFSANLSETISARKLPKCKTKPHQYPCFRCISHQSMKRCASPASSTSSRRNQTQCTDSCSAAHDLCCPCKLGLPGNSSCSTASQSYNRKSSRGSCSFSKCLSHDTDCHISSFCSTNSNCAWSKSTSGICNGSSSQTKARQCLQQSSPPEHHEEACCCSRSRSNSSLTCQSKEHSCSDISPCHCLNYLYQNYSADVNKGNCRYILHDCCSEDRSGSSKGKEVSNKDTSSCATNRSRKQDPCQKCCLNTSSSSHNSQKKCKVVSNTSSKYYNKSRSSNKCVLGHHYLNICSHSNWHNKPTYRSRPSFSLFHKIFEIPAQMHSAKKLDFHTQYLTVISKYHLMISEHI